MKLNIKTFLPFASILSAIAVTSFILISCSSEEPAKETNNTTTMPIEYANLSIALDDFSTKFENEHQTAPTTRGFFSKLWKAFKADVFVSCRKNLGEWEATTGISIGASNAAWKQLSKDDNMDYSSLSPKAKAEIDLMLENAKGKINNSGLDLGALHNAAILTIIKNEKGSATSLNEIASNSIEALKELGVNTNHINISEINKELSIFMNEIYNDNDDILCERFIKYYPEATNELSIIKKYCNTAMKLQNENDLKDFTAGYQEIVKKSHIEDVSKLTIERTLSIAPSSAQLWNKIDSLD